ncbi:MAG: hypothetical protein ACPHLK_09980 [Gammaproteobacteria bacterium]
MIDLGSFSLGTLLGIFLTSLVNHFLAKSRNKENRERHSRMEAGEKLNEAFASALIFLSPHVIEDKDAYDVLNESFKAHASAVMQFRRHLSESEKGDFDKAWYEYYCHDGDKDAPFLEQYSSHIGSHESYLENCSLAVKRINKILSYANT